jgi:hypothetical protein
VRPVTTHMVVGALVVQVPDGDPVTEYPVIGDPPSDDGAVQLSDT